MEKARIISIYGLTAVGKSTVSKALMERLGTDKACRLSLDRYLLDKPEDMPTIDYLQSPVDWNLVKSHLNMPQGSRVKSPDFDFTTFKHVSDGEGKELVLTPTIIVDGAWPYKDADISIKLTASSDERKKRLIDRHLGERNGADKQWVEFAQENWDALPGEHPDFRPTLVIDTEKSLEEILNDIEKYLA